MSIAELRLRLRAMTATISGNNPNVSVVIDGAETVYVSARSDYGRDLYRELGNDLDKMLDDAQRAIDEASPLMLARTLGIEPAPAVEQVAAE